MRLRCFDVKGGVRARVRVRVRAKVRSRDPGRVNDAVRVKTLRTCSCTDLDTFGLHAETAVTLDV